MGTGIDAQDRQDEGMGIVYGLRLNMGYAREATIVTPQIPQVPDTGGGRFGRHSNELGCLGLSLMVLLLIAVLTAVIFLWR